MEIISFKIFHTIGISSVFLSFFLDIRNVIIGSEDIDFKTILEDSASPWMVFIFTALYGVIMILNKLSSWYHKFELEKIERKIKNEELESKEIQNDNLRNYEKNK